MIFGGGITTYLMVGVGVLTLAFGVYFFWSQAELSKRSAEITALAISNKNKDNALEQLGVDIESIKTINEQLADIERESARSAADLADTLSGLDRIAREKPKIVEKLVNDASKERNRCFALATGAKPEKNEKNDTCPHFLK